MVDIDQAEIDKMEYEIECPVNFDALEFIDEALRQVDKKNNDFFEWVGRCVEWKKRYPVVLDEYWKQDELVNNYVIIDVLSDLAGQDDLIIPGSSGASSEVTNQAFKIKKEGTRLFNSHGLGSMGFGIPAAIGGCIASGYRRTICIDGDGGFVMNIQELETVKRLNLPIKFFILNNGGYVSIRNSQDRHFDKQVASGEDSGVTLPEFKKVCKSYGIPYTSVCNHQDLHKNVEKILETQGPIVCEVMMQHTHQSLPRNSTYKGEDGKFVALPMEDLIPLLPREEFEENMRVGNA